MTILLKNPMLRNVHNSSRVIHVIGDRTMTWVQTAWLQSLKVNPLGVVHSLSHVWFFATPWVTTCQASLSLTVSQSLLRLIPIESMMPSNHRILCRHLLLLPSFFPSIRVFSYESVLHIRWPKYRSFSFSTSPSNEYSGLISFGVDWFDLVMAGLRSRRGVRTEFCPLMTVEVQSRGPEEEFPYPDTLQMSVSPMVFENQQRGEQASGPVR